MFPRTASSAQVELTTYAAWFAQPLQERAAYVHQSERVHPLHLCSLIRFRTGSHWLRVVSVRWRGVPREQRGCPLCSSGSVQDEMHMVFECPAFVCARQRHQQLFLGFGGWTRSARGSKCMQAFMAQHQPSIAAFIHACMERQRSFLTVDPSEEPLQNNFEEILEDIAPRLARRLLTAPYVSTAGT